HCIVLPLPRSTLFPYTTLFRSCLNLTLRRWPLALPLFAVTLFVSAFLLFLVQPMIGKLILPKLGGTPQVWNTCMLFFQLALLARSEEHTSELQSRGHLVCRLLL